MLYVKSSVLNKFKGRSNDKQVLLRKREIFLRLTSILKVALKMPLLLSRGSIFLVHMNAGLYSLLKT